MDAHVGKTVFDNAILGALKNRGKTVLLVTHALPLVSRVDYIFVLSNGRIAEQGPYDELLRDDGPFAKLVRDFGGERDNEGKTSEKRLDAEAHLQAERDAAADGKGRFMASKAIGKAAGTGKLEGRLIRREKRTVGRLSSSGECS